MRQDFEIRSDRQSNLVRQANSMLSVFKLQQLRADCRLFEVAESGQLGHQVAMATKGLHCCCIGPSIFGM